MYRIGDIVKRELDQRLYVVVDVDLNASLCYLKYIYTKSLNARAITDTFGNLLFIDHFEVSV